MEAIQISKQLSSCDGPLPDLEVPMITTMVNCLASEHRKLDILNLRLALAATRLARDPEAERANQCAIALWDEIRRVLWSHLQIENGLVLSWGEAHSAISTSLLDTLKNEFQQVQNIVAEVPGSSSVQDNEPRGRAALAWKLLAFTQVLDSHLERYEREVLPSILRAAFQNRPAKD